MPRDSAPIKKAILYALKRKDDTLDGLVLRTKLGKTTVWRWVTAMHDHEDPAKREVHVVKWEYPEHGGRPMPTYAAGPGEDAPCTIEKMNDSQRGRRHRAKARADGRWEERLARQQAIYWADRALTVRDPMIEALFGPPAHRQPMTLETA